MNDREFIAYIRDQCNAQLGAAPPVTPPVQPPVQPPITPPPQPGVGIDLSDKAMHTFFAGEGQIIDCFFRSSQGTAEVEVIPVAGSGAKSIVYSINSAAEQEQTPSGSDFHAELINGWVAPPHVTIRFRLVGIIGYGQFGVQAVGNGVGP